MSRFLKFIWIAAMLAVLAACGDKPESLPDSNQDADEKFLDQGEPNTPAEGF